MSNTMPRGSLFTGFPRPSHNIIVGFGWLIFIASFIIIGVSSMTPVGAPPSGMHLDKILHAIAYGVLTFGLVFAWPRRALPLIFAVTFIYGIILEIMQGTLAEGRTASLFDALANGLGALLIIGLWIWICPRLKHNPA